MTALQKTAIAYCAAWGCLYEGMFAHTTIAALVRRRLLGKLWIDLDTGKAAARRMGPKQQRVRLSFVLTDKGKSFADKMARGEA